MKKLKFKTIFIGLSIIGITTTMILTSGILVSSFPINVAGSSAVQPLMVAFANKYPDSDLVTQAGGSGAGIRAILDGTKQIGMASKSPNVIVNENDTNISAAKLADSKKWIDRKIKTVTIAWDGMGLIYKPKDKETEIDVNIDTIKQIYTIFSGKDEFKLSDIDNSIKEDTIITPFARAGGSAVSGTADAFYKDSNLKYKVTPEEKKSLDASLNTGDYGKFTKTTAEANSQAWSFVKNENKIGSMTYLSAGFINNNLKEIQDSGFKVATYNKENISLENITKGYKWFRPLNLMLSIEPNSATPGIIKEKDSQSLINWIMNDEIAINIIKDQGYIPLTSEQVLELMTSNNNIDTFWTTDDKAIFDKLNPVKPLVSKGNNG